MPCEPGTPLGKAIAMLLEDRLMAFKPEDMDIQYSARYGEAERLEEQLLSILPATMKIVYGVKGQTDETAQNGAPDAAGPNTPAMEIGVHEILNKLRDERDWLIAAAAEMAYKKGFSEALKFLCHCLAMS